MVNLGLNYRRKNAKSNIKWVASYTYRWHADLSGSQSLGPQTAGGNLVRFYLRLTPLPLSKIIEI